jgi:DNA-3-methyladenine glycosylase
VLARSWFERAAPVVAPDLLGKVIEVRLDGVLTSGRIVETEAYTADDPASHSYRGPTRRNATMFGPAGHLYVYLSHGLHACANVVTGGEATGAAVLIRAVEPITGMATMRARRGEGRPVADGPGKLCQALGIRLTDDGVDLTAPRSPIRIVDDGTPPPDDPIVGPRIGITRGADTPWRWRAPVRPRDDRP